MLANCIRQEKQEMEMKLKAEMETGNGNWKQKWNKKWQQPPVFANAGIQEVAKGLIGNGRLAKQAIKNWRQEELWNA